MKVFITGGDGFVGKALATALSSRGFDIVFVDRKRDIIKKVSGSGHLL